MQIEDADIVEFMALWKEEFGEPIPLEEARLRAAQVMELYTLLATMSPPEQSARRNCIPPSP